MAVTAAAQPARTRRWPVVAAWALWTLAVLGLAATFWLDHQLGQAGRPDLAQLAAFPAVALVSTATVGTVLGRRVGPRGLGRQR